MSSTKRPPDDDRLWPSIETLIILSIVFMCLFCVAGLATLKIIMKV